MTIFNVKFKLKKSEIIQTHEQPENKNDLYTHHFKITCVLLRCTAINWPSITREEIKLKSFTDIKWYQIIEWLPLPKHVKAQPANLDFWYINMWLI